MEELFQEVLTYFSPILKPNHFEKGKLLHKANEISLELFLVRSGVLRSFYSVDGKDVTAHFALDHGVVGAADSIIRRKRSRYHIEALKNSGVFLLNYDELEVFFDLCPCLTPVKLLFSGLRS